ncbi:MAG: hypothetical protein M1423_02095 [Acidobacteria bacterium]|nr:hypothetical protein [Acidobacteriota bacterium]
MSRGGKIYLARLRELRRQKLKADSTVLVEKAIREMQGECCSNLASFFLESVQMTLTSPVEESLKAYECEIAREGALHINASGAYEDDYMRLHLANVQMAQEKGIDLPPVLVDQPPFVTSEALQVQKDLSGLLSGDFKQEEAGELAEQLQSTISRTQESYDMACLVAGCHLDDPQHPVFDSAAAMIHSLGSDTRNQIQSWVDETKGGLKQQAAEAWAATALGAARVAIDMSGLDISQVDLAGKTIRARDHSDPAKTITIDVDTDSATLSYDISGYEARACEPIERRFLHNLEAVLGVSIQSSSRVSRPKPESCVRRKELPVKSQISDKGMPPDSAKIRE